MENLLKNIELKLLTSTSEYMCYKYDNKEKVLYLDFCFSGDLADVKFSPFAIISEIEYKEIPYAAQMCIYLYGSYGYIKSSYEQLVEFYLQQDY